MFRWNEGLWLDVPSPMRFLTNAKIYLTSAPGHTGHLGQKVIIMESRFVMNTGKLTPYLIVFLLLIEFMEV